MPGLSFLSKKSWHTSNIKNIEKVWIAEQKADEEKKKLDELQKQLEEERQIQELRQLQAAHGQAVKTVDTSLDWMYEGPAASVVQNQQTEEYLLGKVFSQNSTNTFEVANTYNNKHSNEQRWMEKISAKTDVFSRMHEDPLLVIKQREKQQRDQVLINPIRMSQIRQNIARELEDHELEKERKRGRKHHKESKEEKAKKERKDTKDKKDKAQGDSRKRKHESDESSEFSDERIECNPGKNGFRYGLQNKEVISKDYLGPRPELLQQRDAERQKEIDDRRRQINAPKMTQEQREERLKRMEQAAEFKYHGFTR